MTMHSQWDRSIQGRWLKTAALLATFAGIAGAQNLSTLTKQFLEAPSPAGKQALLKFAQSHPRDAQGAFALLAVGSHAIQAKEYDEAVQRLSGLSARLPKLADYAQFYLGQAELERKNYAAAIAALAPVYQERANALKSPFANRAILMTASALTADGRPKEAIALIGQHRSLPKADSEMVLGAAFEAAGDDVSAAAHYQTAYFEFPTWNKSEEVKQALLRLQQKLGANYPPVMPRAYLTRAAGLAQARNYTAAREVLESALSQLTGAERELAEVRIGAYEQLGRRYSSAYNQLKPLKPASAEAGAERLYYLVEACRRLERRAEIPALLAEFESKYPDSRWRAESLANVAYEYLYRNEPDGYLPLYRACATGPEERQASFCDWKVTWHHYLREESRREAILKDHVKRFPTSEKVPASLYFLGRQAERSKQVAVAKAYYSEVSHRFPNHYYAVLSRERLQDAAIAKAGDSPQTTAFVASLNLPDRRRSASFEPLATTKMRIERAKMLDDAGFAPWAEDELRYAARNGEQPQVLTMELARLLNRRGASEHALRAVKAYFPEYLMIPMESAPADFWRVAFPMPYRNELLKNARLNEVDPFVVAGLVRQESEFDPKAVSRARALGLSQVLPSTGRDLSRRVGMTKFHPDQLFNPDINLRLGTYYIRNLLNSLNGKWEAALASYNGGRSRVVRWAEWANFQEPSEFIETIPIAETRDYVQIVLRNATVYRQLYEGSQLEVTSTDAPAPAAPRPAAPAARKPAAKPAVKRAAKPVPKRAATTKTAKKPATRASQVSKPTNAQVH